jgi:hypothetical protein
MASPISEYDSPFVYSSLSWFISLDADVVVVVAVSIGFDLLAAEGSTIEGPAALPFLMFG